MTKINFNIDRCKGCGLCVPVCPVGIIRMCDDFNKTGHKYAEVTDPEKCTGCTMCCRICPDLVIEITESPAVQDEIKEQI